MRQMPEIFSFGVPEGKYSAAEFDRDVLPFQMREAAERFPGVTFEDGQYLVEDGFYVYRCRGTYRQGDDNEQ